MKEKEIKDLENKIRIWKDMNKFKDFSKEIAEAEAELHKLKQQDNSASTKIDIKKAFAKADTVEKVEVIKIEESKVDTVEAEEIEVVDFEELGEDVTDKRYYKKDGSPILMPINSTIENVKNKKVNKLNESILIYFSNYQDLHEVEEYDGYDSDRYIYENKIIKNKDLVEQYSKTKINTFIRNVRKLSKIESGIISVEQHKGENVYRINKGEKYVLIERKILEVLIDSCSNPLIKVYIFLKWRVGEKGGIVSRKEIAQNIGYSANTGERQLKEIVKDIETTLVKLGLVRRQTITLDSMENGNEYNKATYYEVVPYSEWIKFWNNGKNAIDFKDK